MRVEKQIRVETFQFIDNLEHIINPKDVLEDCENYIEIVKNAFLRAGWEGDGEIGLIWLPPFVNFQGGVNGEYIWHVKQENNGISFLGFEEVHCDSSAAGLELKSEYIPTTMTSDDTNVLLKQIGKYRVQLRELSDYLKNNKSFPLELYQITLTAVHGGIVASFFDYLDGIYLDIVQYVFGCENEDRLKLSKINVKLPLDEISKGIDDGYFNSWLLLRYVESAIWKDFKFWSFKDKLREICRAVGYDVDEGVKRNLRKHIEIRNAFQHHSGQFTSEMRKAIAQDYIDLLDESGKYKRCELWNIIELSVPEIEELCDYLENFANSYELHIKKHMTYRQYKYVEGGIVSTFKPLEVELNEDIAIVDKNVSDGSRKYKNVSRKIELIDYIYYLQYTVELDEIVVKTENSDYVVYESSTFKVNYEECTAEEFYGILLSLGTTISCNGYKFECVNNKIMSVVEIPMLEQVFEESNIITL